MSLLTGKITKAKKVRSSFVYNINEIPAIFSNLGDWWAAKTITCLLRFSAMDYRIGASRDRSRPVLLFTAKTIYIYIFYLGVENWLDSWLTRCWLVSRGWLGPAVGSCNATTPHQHSETGIDEQRTNSYSSKERWNILYFWVRRPCWSVKCPKSIWMEHSKKPIS